MLKTIRKITAIIFFVLLTLLFLDFTGTLHVWLGWMAKIQLMPALLAVNVIALVILVLLTLLFGRIYCSIICPLGTFQDGISYVSGRRKGKKNRFHFVKAKSWLRYIVLILFIVALVAGLSVIVSLLDPYAAYGRIASNLFAPVYRLGNNLFAWIAERADSYAFYRTDVWIKSGITFGVAILTAIIVAILAWRNGRTYCNTICPVGTTLGLLSRFAIFRVVINEDRCGECKLCEKGCKASCIDVENRKIDHSRCVVCFDCIDRCNKDAIKYAPVWAGKKGRKSTSVETPNVEEDGDGVSRRNFLTITGLFALSTVGKSQQLQMDGGLAELEEKKIPKRNTPVVPPGAQGAAHLQQHCTACQLCVSSCPNNVLRPSNKLSTLMQPEMSFERGYCRPECTECSHVCPSKAISPVDAADKSSISIGHAVWIEDNCVVLRDEVRCTACSRNCPTGAIMLVKRDPDSESSLMIPTVNKELCIGCGACEYVCPARPFSAIYVEGNVKHHSV